MTTTKATAKLRGATTLCWWCCHSRHAFVASNFSQQMHVCSEVISSASRFKFTRYIWSVYYTCVYTSENPEEFSSIFNIFRRVFVFRFWEWHVQSRLMQSHMISSMVSAVAKSDWLMTHDSLSNILHLYVTYGKLVDFKRRWSIRFDSHILFYL